MKKSKHEAGLTKEALAAGVLLLLAGCAAAPSWQPPATHTTIAVTSVLNPYSSLYTTGKSSADDEPAQAEVDLDINRQIRDALHADLASTGMYTVVDMDTDPGSFAVSKFIQHAPSILHPHSFSTLDPDLTDILIEQAKGVGASFVVAAVDIRYQHVDCGPALGCATSVLDVLLPDTGWGLHHSNYKQCEPASTYLDYYVFVIDVDSGDTVASFQSNNERVVKDIDIDHQDLGALADPQKAEIDTEMADMVQKSLADSLTHLNLLPGGTAAAGPGLNICPGVTPTQAAAAK